MTTVVDEEDFFRPTQIPGCVLWLDASDRTTFTGGSTWFDKSGTGNHGINGIPGTTSMPTPTVWTNGLQAARFLESRKNSVRTTNTIPQAEMTYFMVVRLLGLPSSESYLIINSTSPLRRIVSILTNGTINATAKTSPVAQILTGIQNLTPNQQGFVYSATVGSTGFRPYGNSVAPGNTVFDGTTDSVHYFCSNLTDANYSSVDVGEILIYNSLLSTADRNLVEGYLGWKWNLLNDINPIYFTYINFPSSFPYKQGILAPLLNPPVIPAEINEVDFFAPTDFPNCALWFDMSDTNTVTTQGRQVTSIRNKGTQSNLSATNTQATGAVGSPWTSWPPPGTTNYNQYKFSTSSRNTVSFTQTPGSGGAFGNGFNGSYLRISGVSLTSKSRTIFFVIGFNAGGSDNFSRVIGSTNLLSTGTNASQVGFTDFSAPGYTIFPVNYSGSEVLGIGGTAPFSAPLNSTGTPYGFAVRHTTAATGLGNYGSVNGTPQNFYTNQLLNVGYATGTDEMMIGIGLAYTKPFMMGEVIYYDGTLTNAQIQQVEGYLAWKWGYQSTLPASHPYRNSVLGPLVNPPSLITQIVSAAWLPTQITGATLSFWLDASVPTGFTSNANGIITGVSDRSGNGRNLTNSLTTTGFQRVTSFNGTYPSFFYNNAAQNVTLGSNASFSLNQPATVFAVCQRLGSGANQDLFDATDGTNRFFAFYNQAQNTYRIFAGATLVQNGTMSPNPALYTHIFNSTASEILENGISVIVGDAGALNCTGITIGSRFTQNQETWQGHIAEILYFTTALPLVQRQQVEGYLAWKWGLVGNLPNNHLFKLYPPPP